ncbi:hypothetical protein [Tritonibacter litoralis]|nr:hypothetical protein [Tritonibacter litoralis]
MAEAGSFSGTAKLLNVRGMKTRKGGKWHPQTVKNYADSLKGAKRALAD